MKRKLICANWKCHFSKNDVIVFLNKIKNTSKKNTDCLIAMPSLYLDLAQDLAHESIIISAQNAYFEDKGAFTGEISFKQLKDLSIHHSIIGHSERRIVFGESDEIIQKKVQASIRNSIHMILCIGETQAEREANQTYEVIKKQLDWALKDFPKPKFTLLTVAYEPVWAIGTGLNANSDQIQSAHACIKAYLDDFFSHSSEFVRIIYGGSMNDKNAAEILNIPHVDGGLIGSASLQIESFQRIIEIADTIGNSHANPTN